jgi:small subunit ribosomal protein S16
MAVKLRLRREGTVKRPHYRIVAADSRSPRDGRFIEILGSYHPMEEPSTIRIDAERALHWLRHGAQPTSAVERLLRIEGVWETFKPGDTVENEGSVEISTRRVLMNADEDVLLSVSDKTAMRLTRTDAALYGHTTRLVSRISSYVIDGGVAWVPADKVEVGLVPYDDLKPVLEEIKSTMQEVEWLAPYTPETRDAIVFSHRSTSQYGTDIASEVDGSQFFVYQPVWVFMSRGGAPSLSGLSTDKWIEKDVEDTYPWPGADYYKGSTAYVRLKSENNIAAGTGVSKRRDELVPEGGELERVSFDEYEKAKG